MTSITPEQLLAEIDDVIKDMPPRATIGNETPENLSWLGRASAVIRLWNQVKAITFDDHVRNIHATMSRSVDQGFLGALTMLHEASHELRLRTVGPLTTAIAQGSMFDYFDEVRKVIEAAKYDLLFADPYLDAEFVSRYLPQVSQGVSVRLLASKRITALLPAANLLHQKNNLAIEVRSADGFHDRYVFVDRQLCYLSGASFKDGAKKAPTTLTQIVDAFAAVSATYEEIWTSATIHQ